MDFISKMAKTEKYSDKSLRLVQFLIRMHCFLKTYFFYFLNIMQICWKIEEKKKSKLVL